MRTSRYPRLSQLTSATAKGDGRNKLYASSSRYFESIPQLIQFAAFGGAATVDSYNFDPAAGAFAPDPRGLDWRSAPDRDRPGLHEDGHRFSSPRSLRLGVRYTF
jgi:hypothetical protein